MGEKRRLFIDIANLAEFIDHRVGIATSGHGVVEMYMRVWHRRGTVEYIVEMNGEMRHRSKSLSLAVECANELEEGL